jgi:LysM repeat protein
LAAFLTVLAVIVVAFVVPALSRSTQPPTQQQPLAPASVETSAVVVPPLPPAPYLVQAGDTMQHIADQSGVSLHDLLSWNPTITDPDYIETGQAVVTAAPPG